MRFHVVIIRPFGYEHADAFTDMAELVQVGLSALGYTVTRSENRWDTAAVNIIFGAHHLVRQTGGWSVTLPPRTIIYNLEPLIEGSPWTTRALATAFAQVPVWDYSIRNAVYRQQHHWFGSWYTVPVGYMPQWTRIVRQSEPDIDVLFYGSLSLRRRRAIEALQIAGIHIRTLFGVYGADRDSWISRSRVVLNLHQATEYPFESVRVGYVLANRCTVVSEGTPDKDLDAARWQTGIAWTRYHNVVETCRTWLADHVGRTALADRGWQVIQRYPETDYLAAVLEQMAATHLL